MMKLIGRIQQNNETQCFDKWNTMLETNIYNVLMVQFIKNDIVLMQ